MKRYPFITTVTLTTKDMEYAFDLPGDTKSYTIKIRGNNEFKVAYTQGDIAAGNYITVPAGSSLAEDNLYFEDTRRVFVSCEKSGTTLEVAYWK